MVDMHTENRTSPLIQEDQFFSIMLVYYIYVCCGIQLKLTHLIKWCTWDLYSVMVPL